jgi:mRNA interferase RelE/StbE
MVVKFERTFLKDLENINDKKLGKSVKSIIEDLENAANLSEIKNLKKMKGHSAAFRIRIGDYRIGLFFLANQIELIRFLHRKEIYRKFPK